MKTSTSLAALSAAATVSAQSADSPVLPQPRAVTPLPLGSITPTTPSWLASTLALSAAGLAGNEYTFYRYVQNSSWLGGSYDEGEYSDLREGFPYWFNGLVPLAYSLDDETLKAQVHEAAGKVLEAQWEDGWIGPESADNGGRNFWARFPFMLGLTNLIDANSTWEAQAVPAMSRFYELMHTMLSNNYTGYWYHDGDSISSGDTTWGRVRYQDMVISLLWMYEKHASSMSDSQILVDNMNFLINGSITWNAWYNEDAYIQGDLYQLPVEVGEIGGPLYPYEHGVNVGQGLKAPAVDRRVTGNSSLLETAANAFNWTFSYHGAASGTILADERIDGLSPWSGSELCTAVETIYSLSYLYQALGDSSYADMAERTAFNALPAMLTEDWWSHQYMAQPNQPFAENLTASPFSTSNTYANVFGLEPQYPCCTVNHPQGLPKFLMGSYVAVGENGLAHALLGPAGVSTTLQGGGKVTVECVSDYPFGGVLRYTVASEGAFDFAVRVPEWYEEGTSSIAVNGDAAVPLSPDGQTALHTLHLPAGKNTVVYTLGSSIRTVPRANDTIAVYAGALMYALDVANTNSSQYPRTSDGSAPMPAGLPAETADWTFENSTAWNYAIDPATLSLVREIGDGHALPEPVFAPGNTGLSMSARGCLIEWPLWLGSVPGAPPTGSERVCLGDPVNVTLVPYGSVKTRMGELPTVDLGELRALVVAG